MAAPYNDLANNLFRDAGHLDPFKQALFDTLSGCLSSELTVRKDAEAKIKAFEVTEEYGAHLAEFVADRFGETSIRQMSAVLLRQYVDHHWTKLSENFMEPIVQNLVKVHVRMLLLSCIGEPVSRLRTSIAHVTASIAHWDWPDDWLELFPSLLEALRSKESDKVHGAMRVFTEFSRDVTDSQMPEVAPVLIPEIYNVFIDASAYGVRTRSRAVEIFTTCVHVITLREQSDSHKKQLKLLLQPVLPKFIEAMVSALQAPDSDVSDIGLKQEIIKAFIQLMMYAKKKIAPHLSSILMPVWNLMTRNADLFVKTVVNNVDDRQDPTDSDGETIGFESLVYRIFEFIDCLLESSKLRQTMKKTIDQLFYYLIMYCELSEDQMADWLENPDKFVEDEDEDTFSYTVRISAHDLLLNVCREFEREGAIGLMTAVTQQLQQAEIAKRSGDPNWWKIHEACLLSMGSVHELIVETVQRNNACFDLPGFLHKVVLVDLAQEEAGPFLVGRALWTASRYAAFLQPEVLHHIFQATQNALSSPQPSPIKILACQSVYYLCDHVLTTDKTELLTPFLPGILDGLVPLGAQHSTHVLSLVLDALHRLLRVNKDFTATMESKVGPLCNAVFLKLYSDPMIMFSVMDIVGVLASHPTSQAQIEARIVQTLISILEAPKDKVSLGLPAVAIDMLTTLVKKSGSPLSELLMNKAFPVALLAAANSDDHGVQQNGGELTRAYVNKCVGQVVAFRDQAGITGMTYVMNVVSLLLNPSCDEASGLYVGKLVTSIIRKLGDNLGEHLEAILRAVLSKMQQVQTPLVMQSLIMVFAHTLHTKLEAVLEFLAGVPDPTGKSALQFLLTVWCENQNIFYGNYDQKVSTLALCKLLSHAISTNDSRLQGITVEDEAERSPHEGIKTRAQHPQIQHVTVPVLCKIFKLITNELGSSLEKNTARLPSEADEDSWEDDSGEECDNENGEQWKGHDDMIESLIKQFAPAGEDDSDEDYESDIDEDTKLDPIYQTDLQAYLAEFIKEFSRQPYFSMFTPYLGTKEKQHLAAIGVQS